MNNIQFQLLFLTIFFGISLGETAVGSRKQPARLLRLKEILGDKSLMKHRHWVNLISNSKWAISCKCREEKGPFKTPLISDLSRLVSFLYLKYRWSCFDFLWGAHGKRRPGHSHLKALGNSHSLQSFTRTSPSSFSFKFCLTVSLKKQDYKGQSKEEVESMHKWKLAVVQFASTRINNLIPLRTFPAKMVAQILNKDSRNDNEVDCKQEKTPN